jgi:hypothetical protein
MVASQAMKSEVLPTSMPSEDTGFKKAAQLNDLLVRVVDEVINQIFKEAGAEVIYSFFEGKCNLKLEEFGIKSDEFCAGLTKLLSSAAPVIEKSILDKYHRSLGLNFVEKSGYVFSDYIRELKDKFIC